MAKKHTQETNTQRRRSPPQPQTQARTLPEEELHRVFFENANDACAIFRENGEILLVNPAIERLLGWSPAELQGQPISTVATAETLAHAEERTRQWRAGQRVPTLFEMDLIRKDGGLVPVEAHTRVIQALPGHPLLFQGIFRDITVRKEVATALAQQEAYFRALIENAAEMIIVLGEDGAIRYSSPPAARILGYSPADEATRLGFDFVHPDDRATVMEAFRRVLEHPDTPIALELRVQHKDGAWRIVQATGTNLLQNPAVRGIVINSRDVTQQKQEEDNARTLVDSIVDVIYTLNADGTVRSLNAPFEMITGWSVTEWEGQSFADLVHPDDLPLAVEMFQRALNYQDTPMFELRIRTKTGEYKIGEFRGKALEQGGKPVVLGVSRDITERRKAEIERDEAEQKLRQSETYRAQVADTMPDILYVYDLQSRALVYLNRQVGLLGYTPEELRLKHGGLEDLLHPEDAAALRDRYARLLTEDARDLEDIEYRARHLNGEWRWFADRSTVFQRTAEGRPIQVLGVAQDITERKRLERLLQQREVQPKELADRLRKFRDSLGLTQDEFGKEFGKYKAAQISTYETGAAMIPTELFVSIWAKGFPLEVIFGASPTEIIEKTALYFTTNYADRQYTRQVLEAVVQMLKKDEILMARALRELDLSPRSLSTDQRNLLEALSRAWSEEK